jgi:hypothetical protein
MPAPQGWRFEFSFLGIFMIVLFPGLANPECSSLTNSGSTVVGDQIFLQPGSGVAPSLINGAIGQWSSGCSGSMGSDFPNLVNGSNPNAPTYNVVMGGNSPDSSCGRTQGTTITLYTTATDGATRFDCGSMTLNLAHEIGHVLGLADAPGATACQFHIMAGINRDNAFSRSVQGDECTQVDFKWRTSAESSGPIINPPVPPPCI